MVPTVSSNQSCNLAPIETLKLRLIDAPAVYNPNARVNMASAKTNEHKNFEDSLGDLFTNLQGFSQKLASIFDCVLGVLDRMEAMEARGLR